VGTVQNLSFNYDALGNLTYRADQLNGKSESFAYDNLNRLTSKDGAEIVTYEINGNIRTKKDVSGGSSGTYEYDGNRPHAVRGAFGYAMTYDGNGNLLTRKKGSEEWSTRWAGFDKPRWLAKGNVGSEFLYNASRSRIVHLEFDQVNGNGVPTHYARKKVYAFGATMEVDYRNATNADGSVSWRMERVRIYVPGPDGSAGAMEFSPAAQFDRPDRTFVYHYDHLGSIERITPFSGSDDKVATDEAGAPARYSYDAWGQRRDGASWDGVPKDTASGGASDITPRGYTGHEMLDGLELIHLNGRIYDPVLGRFLSADLFVSDPNSVQSFNRYSYVRNNPLSTVDPSGYKSLAEIADEERKKIKEAIDDRQRKARNEQTTDAVLGNNPILARLKEEAAADAASAAADQAQTRPAANAQQTEANSVTTGSRSEVPRSTETAPNSGTTTTTQVQLLGRPVKGDPTGSLHGSVLITSGDKSLVVSAMPSRKLTKTEEAKNIVFGINVGIKIQPQTPAPKEQSGEYKIFGSQDSSKVFRSDAITVNATFDQVAARVVEINTAISAAQFEYYGRAQNSNSYAFTVFGTLTGQAYTTPADFPGSDRWLVTPATPVLTSP
jgi:RHS repeat-associated protein